MTGDNIMLADKEMFFKIENILREQGVLEKFEEENGKVTPVLEKLTQIATTFEASTDYLTGKSEKTNDNIDNIELLFSMNSRGLTNEEKEVFKRVD